MDQRHAALPTLLKIAATLRGLFLVIHPFPAFLNALAGAVFYVMAARVVDGVAVATIFFSIFLIHASIGSLNDYWDIDLDTKTKPQKPIVRGDIGPRGALALSFLAALGGALLSLSFNWLALAVALLVLVAGMAYNMLAKGNVYSWVPYAVAIPALPVWAFAAADAFTPIVLVSFPLGALMSLALNIANTIPDLEGDTRYGLQGIAHRLGLKRSLLTVWLCFGATIVLLSLTPKVLGNDPTYLFGGIALGAALLMVMIFDRVINGSPASLRRGWYLSAIDAAVLGFAWVASLPTG